MDNSKIAAAQDALDRALAAADAAGDRWEEVAMERAALYAAQADLPSAEYRALRSTRVLADRAMVRARLEWDATYPAVVAAQDALTQAQGR